MDNKKVIYFFLVTLLAIALILGIIIVASKKKSDLKVYFLDVGQGDAILVTSGNNQVLIDSGRNGRITLEKLGRSMPFWDRKIETLIVTHPDADHYGGFDEVLDFYRVENIIKTEAKNDSGEWLNLLDKLKNKKVTEINPGVGTKIIFPSGANMEIIYPVGNLDIKEDKNENSIVTRLVFGENEFLFTGDLSKEGEAVLLASNLNIEADFLKVAHHGSHSSTSLEFLKKVKPKDAIISVGKNNSYGHPHKEVIDSLKDGMVRIWRTDVDGTIKYNCRNILEVCQAIKF
ncbi:MAG: ComEC/Rec2 family competence protein [Candidatus Moranbacteria bacterium]|jgi:competence protein ComEC|nr:ComEC/Rec2 family competence protein [Candidatus Moranbacteria bacterium]